jgi:hypothetical protein
MIAIFLLALLAAKQSMQQHCLIEWKALGMRLEYERHSS